MMRSHAVLLLALAVVIYGNTLWFGYALDDPVVITDNQFTVRGLSGLKDIFTHDSMVGLFGNDERAVAGGRYRPLALATHAVEYQLFGASPAVSHLVNVLCYGATIVALYLLLKRLFPTAEATAWYRSVPFLATAFFAVHPLHTEVVANIKGRDEILSFLFGLGALLSWLNYLDSQSRSAIIGASACFILALLSKESAIGLLAVAPAIGWYFTRKRPPTILRAWLPLFTAAGVYVVLRSIALSSARIVAVQTVMNDPFLHAGGGQRLATVLLTWLLYLKLLIFPHPLTHDYYPYHIQLVDFSNPAVILSLAVHAALVVLLIMGIRSRTILSFCLVWYVATFVISSNLFFSIGAFMGERFMYIPSVAFCLLLAWALVRRVSHRTALVAVSALVILAGSAQTFARNFAWKDDSTLALTDVQTSRGSARAQLKAGLAYLDMAEKDADTPRKKEHLATAIDHLRESVRIVATFAGITWLGFAYAQSGRYADALELYEAALRLKPAESDIMNNVEFVAQHATETGNSDVAIKAYGTLIAQKPRAAWYAALGMIYGRDLGDLAKAEETLVQGLSNEPDDASLINRLGIIYAMSGRTTDALERFERSIALDPTNSEPYRNEAMALHQLGRIAEAESLERKAAQLDEAVDRSR